MAEGNGTNRAGKSVKKNGGTTRFTANESSVGQKRFLLWSLAIAALALLIAAAAYFYFAREKPIETLKVAAGPYRSDSYELMKEISEVVERQSDYLRLNVIATKDSSQNISTLNRQEVDLATIRSDTPVVANVTMIANLFPDYFQVTSLPGSGIRDIRDLVGKRIAIPPFGTDEFRSFWSIADHYDIAINKIKWIAQPFELAAQRLLRGEIDAVFTVRSLRDRILLNLHEDARLKGIHLNLLHIDQAEAIAVKRPFLGTQIIPKGTFGGEPPIPRRNITVSSVTRTLVARADVDIANIRELTRILFENRLDLIIRFALASAIQAPDLEKGMTIPLHEGAEQYFNRDQPSFLQENAEPIALVITVAAMLFSGLLALRSRLNSGQKNRIDSYNYMLLEIADKARNSKKRSELTNLKNQHYGVLETVVRALDTDEITEEGFQSFALLWESVREVINDRHKMTKA